MIPAAHCPDPFWDPSRTSFKPGPGNPIAIATPRLWADPVFSEKHYRDRSPRAEESEISTDALDGDDRDSDRQG